MPIDERGDLDRLSRSQLYREADAWGLKYPQDMPKYLYENGTIQGGMVALLKSAGVTRQNMKTVKWQTIYPSEQERAAAAHQGMATSEQSYPVQEIHQSARDGVDSSSILQDRLAQSAAKNDLQADKIKKLEADNSELKQLLRDINTKLSAKDKPKRQNRRGELMRAAKAKGIKVTSSLTVADLEKALGENPG